MCLPTSIGFVFMENYINYITVSSVYWDPYGYVQLHHLEFYYRPEGRNEKNPLNKVLCHSRRAGVQLLFGSNWFFLGSSLSRQACGRGRDPPSTQRRAAGEGAEPPCFAGSTSTTCSTVSSVRVGTLLLVCHHAESPAFSLELGTVAPLGPKLVIFARISEWTERQINVVHVRDSIRHWGGKGVHAYL